MSDMYFTAMDFETANSARSSVCAVGIALVEGGAVVRRLHQLIRPQPLHFDPFNISIHGITEAQVRDAPTFADYWSVLWQVVRGPLVAHNASFDVSVLRHVLDQCGQAYPETEYFCTQVVAKLAWPDWPTYALSHVASSLGISFRHHDASEDAYACAQVALQACQALHVDQLSDLVETCGLRVGRLYPDGYDPCGAAKRHSTLNVTRFQEDAGQSHNAVHRSSHAFDNKSFAFTGAMTAMTRKQAAECVSERGGRCDNTVQQTTAYLVVGQRGFTGYESGHKSGKMRKAEEFLRCGCPIEIMSEQDFIEML